jgi:hypothetical protein
VAVTAPISPYVRTLLREKYFAARPDTYLGEEVWSKFENLSKRPHPMGDLWEASYAHYYGDESWSGRTWGMSRRGDQGQIAAIRINRARRNSKARQALILAGMVRAKARAANRDAKSAYAVQLAELMLEYDYKKGGIDSFWAQWVEQTEVFADSYAFTRWVPWKGDVVGIENGRPVYNGDLETTLHAPWLVEFDESYPVADQSPWHYVRTYEPKQDLVLNYTSLLDGRTGDRCADAIWGARGDARLERLSRVAAAEHNTACVVNFIHYPSPVLPLGLFMRQLDADIVLERRPLIGDNGDYDETCPRPLIRLAADEMTDTPHAWAPFWNVLAAQELSDALLTSHATTVTTYNDPIYAVPRARRISPRSSRAAPAGCGTSAPATSRRAHRAPVVTESAMQFDERIAAEMEQDMALNDAVFGRQEGATKNAQADALQASQAVQQVAPAARSASRRARHAVRAAPEDAAEECEGRPVAAHRREVAPVAVARRGHVQRGRALALRGRRVSRMRTRSRRRRRAAGPSSSCSRSWAHQDRRERRVRDVHRPARARRRPGARREPPHHVGERRHPPGRDAARLRHRQRRVAHAPAHGADDDPGRTK